MDISVPNKALIDVEVIGCTSEEIAAGGGEEAPASPSRNQVLKFDGQTTAEIFADPQPGPSQKLVFYKNFSKPAETEMPEVYS